MFEDTNIYVILLIVQKKSQLLPEVQATIIKCQDQVGQALQDAIEGKTVEGKFYSIHAVEQSSFRSQGWLVLAPTESAMDKRMCNLPVLEDFLELRQGIVTGADRIFILDNKAVPADEHTLFIPLLRDREMEAYTVPRRTSQSVFFPYFQGNKLDEEQLRERFPNTWAYLEGHRSELSSRTSLKRYRKEWWEPMWPREPNILLRPKLVVPHLVIMPRFALDIRGRYGVSHSPFLTARVPSYEDSILKMMLAVLNSSVCFWYLQTHSHVYRHGYTMLENKTLAKTPVPDINLWSSSEKMRLISLVDKRMKADPKERDSINAAIELLISDAYGLTANERRALGLEDIRS